MPPGLQLMTRYTSCVNRSLWLTVQIWIGHHYCMSMLACQYTTNQSGLVTLNIDLLTYRSGVRVTCNVGYLCANFSLPTPLRSRVAPDVRDRQIDVRQKHRLMLPPTRSRAICPRPCTPHAAAQLQPIHALRYEYS